MRPEAEEEEEPETCTERGKLSEGHSFPGKCTDSRQEIEHCEVTTERTREREKETRDLGLVKSPDERRPARDRAVCVRAICKIRVICKGFTKIHEDSR